MYTIAGIAQERVTEKSWETLIKEEIFHPLDITQSYTTYEKFMQSQEQALGYQSDGHTIVPPVNLTSVITSGSLWSTPKDMAKWLQMLVNNGQHDGNVYLTLEAEPSQKP